MRYTEITTTTYELDEKSGNYLQTGSSSTEKLPTGLMGDWLTDGARNGGCTDTITITLPDEALPPVKASFSMTGRGTGSGGYDIRIAFSLADAGDADDCRMTPRLSGSVSESTDVYANTAGWSRIDELTITWSNPKITKGAEGNA